ncbi:unnamed protein product [Acanthosepion pharaonis]|uniref:Uncharacterized protein n=1 Tax=Acanthosepion pharaonis TaxID=158019 RepID=A0A812E6D3_ACAPH|nr:unnamed protein product [Sepia pharaonis]
MSLVDGTKISLPLFLFLFFLSFFLSFFGTLLIDCLSFHLPVWLTIFLLHSQSLSLYFCFILFSLFLFLQVSPGAVISLSFSLSLSLSVCLSVYLSLSLFFSLSILSFIFPALLSHIRLARVIAAAFDALLFLCFHYFLHFLLTFSSMSKCKLPSFDISTYRSRRRYAENQEETSLCFLLQNSNLSSHSFKCLAEMLQDQSNSIIAVDTSINIVLMLLYW